MKKPFPAIFSFPLALCFALSAFSLQAQQLKLGNNPTQINKAALLELQSLNQGLRLTRVDTGAVNAVIGTLTKAQQDSTNGMIVFQVKDSSLYYRTGGVWRKLVIADSIGIVSLNGDKAKEQTLAVSSDASRPISFLSPVDGKQVLNIPDADKGVRGVVNIKDQNFEGTKTFLSSPRIATLHPGSVMFIGDNDSLSENNARFYWDRTNGRLGIGTSSPTNTLTVYSKKDGVSGITTQRMTASTPVASTDSSAGIIGVDANGQMVRTVAVKRIFNYQTRNLNNPFQISTSGDTYVSYTLTLSAAAGITGGSNVSATLQISRTKAPGSWRIISRVGLNNSLLGNVLGLTGNLANTLILSGWVPNGDWIQIATSGNVIYVSGQEVTMQ